MEDKNKLYPPIRIKKEIRDKLDELKKEFNTNSYSTVIEILINTYRDCKQKISNISSVTPVLHNTVSGNNSVTPGVTPKTSKSVTPEDEYIDERDFEALYDILLTTIKKKGRLNDREVSEIFKEYLGNKILNQNQYEKIIKLSQNLKDYIVFNGRGYTSK